MKTTKDIQDFIFNKTGIKTSVKTNKGSMKGYLTITPTFQKGERPYLPHDLIIEIKPLLNHFNTNLNPVFCTISKIDVYMIEDERIIYKKENKPKVNNKEPKGWGSKNSQLRLDKATARYVKRLKKGGCATYY